MMTTDAAARRPGLRETETPQIVAGYWLAVLVPILGFVIGIVTYFKDARHGLWIMLVSVLGVGVWIIWVLALLSYF